MPINKATLIKQTSTGTIQYIYPKTTADLVLYTNGKNLVDKINEIELAITNGGTTYDDATISTKGLMTADDKKALIGLHKVNSGNPILIAAVDSDNQDIADPTTAATIHGDLLYNGTTCVADLNIEMKEDCKQLTIYFNMDTNTIFDNSEERILDSGYTFYNINLQTGYDSNNDGDVDDDETQYQTISAACPYKVIVDTSNYINDTNKTGNCIEITSEDNALYTGAIIKVSFVTKLHSGSTTSVEL